MKRSSEKFDLHMEFQLQIPESVAKYVVTLAGVVVAGLLVLSGIVLFVV